MQAVVDQHQVIPTEDQFTISLVVRIIYGVSNCVSGPNVFVNIMLLVVGIDNDLRMTPLIGSVCCLTIGGWKIL